MPFEPTPALNFTTSYEELVLRIENSKRVSVPKEVKQDIENLGIKVDDSLETLYETSRDWWPLSLRWVTKDFAPAKCDLVIYPKNRDEVSSALKLLNSKRIPVTAVAGRSGVCGSAIPLAGGVSMDMRLMTGIIDFDDESLLVRVLPGTSGPELENTLREKYNATLGHWPQSMDLSTVGGWVACRSAGQYSTRYGKIEDMVAGLEVVLANGDVIRTGNQGPRVAIGPDLNQIFTGNEGTLGIVTEVMLKVHPLPSYTRKVAFGFDTFENGIEVCRKILRRFATPAVLRLYDAQESTRHFETQDTHVLIVLDEGDKQIVDAAMNIVEEEAVQTGKSLNSDLVDKWLEKRNDVAALGSLTKIGVVVDTIEISGKWSILNDIYAEATSGILEVKGAVVASAHQSHAYLDGACIYFTFAGKDPDGDSDEFADSFYRKCWDVVMNVVLKHGGGISHHHGIGINRSRYVKAALGSGFNILETLKNTLDPNGILNPGKLGLDSGFVEIDVP